MAGLPLEDTFGDILRKAMRGTGVAAAELARATGIAAAQITAWTRDEGAAAAEHARAVATLLRLDGAYNLQYILITHKHADHCDATGDVAAAFPDAQIVMHELDAPAIGALASKAVSY